MKKTNRLISILLVVAMLLSMAPITVFAATVEASGKFGASGSNLTWSLDSDGVLTISGSGAMEDFANGASMPWYSKRANIKTVVIESGVTNIGKNAFTGFTAIVTATISDTVTSIGDKAFSNSSLANFEFSDAGNLKTIGTSAFNSTNIKNMVIPDGVTTLGSYIFGYGPIKSVTIPASVTSVGNYVFEETSGLNEVIFLGNKEPETIGNTVFLGCSSLAYVSVPADYEGDTFSNMKVAKAAASAAEVNGQGFATLADAISAAQSISGAELKLLSHISIDSGITIESGKFTIDLNGKELFSNGYFLLRIDGADVTIVDSAGGGIFNATNDQGNIVLEVLSGSANISGGTFNSAGYPATVRGGTLKLTGKDFVLNGNGRIGWYGGSIDLSACTADEIRIQACADGLQASAATLPDGWGLFKTDGTPCTEFVKNDIYVAKAGFKVTASVNPAEGGTVEGAGAYSSGATVTLTASASNGYRFVNWIENGEEVSTSAVYTFTASENRELTANFEIVPHTHSFTYTAGLNGRIVATCVADGCTLENGNGGTLTIYAPADLYADGITAKEATIENNLVDTSVAISDITYSAPYGLPPKDAGTYTASVTVGGATATVEFTLLNYAAKVTDKDGNAVGTYKTFADAITAAQDSEGSTVTLLDDITLTTRQDIRSGKFTLDLNGKTLYSEDDMALSLSYNADLTIVDSGENGAVIASETSAYVIVMNRATLTVNSGLISSGNESIDVGSNSKLTVNGGTIEGREYSIYGGSSDIELNNGSFNGAVWSFSSYEINGGNYTADFIGINAENGVLTVNAGEFDIEEILILKGTVTLNGGEFTNGFVIDDLMYDSDEQQFVNDILADGYAYYDKDGSKITVADDATKIDGYVQVKEHFVACVTDKDGNELEGSPYKTLADAITAAEGSEGSTVTLLDDVTLTEEQDISSGKFTLDLNGKTLLNETAAAICIESDADVTIKDSGEGGTIESKADTWNTVYNYGTLTVESGIIKGERGISNSSSGTLNFKSGKIEADTYYAIGNFGTAYIYNGSFKAVSSGAIENNSDSTVYVYGGEFSGSAGIVNHGTAYIEGGEFKGNSYAALNLLGGTVEVTGGSFTGTDFASGSYSGTPYGEYTVYCNEGASLILKGGEFPNGFVVAYTTANTFLAEDYYYKDADGKLIDVAEDARVIDGYVKITKGADLADAVITLDETQFTYSGMEHKPTVIVTVGGRTLAEGTDYTVSYANNINAGTATVTIKAVGQAAGGIAGGGNIGNSSNAGEITESGYTGEVTKTFTINRKPVTVTATAPDKVYDGTTDILEYSEITVTINGAVEGEMLGVTVGKAWYDSADAGEGKTVHIIYTPVASSSIDNYEFPANSEYSTDNYYVATTADISRKDISDGFIILGDSLTYNGTEQTQTVEKVLTTNNLEATFDISGNKATNVGVYLLTVTGTGNFTGEAKLSYEIALDKKCVSHIDLVYVENNGVYERRWKVKSTDKESVQYVLSQLNNAVTDIAPENKKERWNEMKAACEEILGIINCVEEALADVEKDYALYSEDTVKASDTDALNKIVEKVNEIKERYGYYLTEEEEKRLDDILAGVEKLRAKIAATAQEVADIEEAADVYNPDTVTSADKAELEAIIADADAVNPENLTEEQKTALNAVKSELEGLLEKIAQAGKAVEDIGAQLEMLDENRVTIFWEDEIEALKAKIDELLANTNMGEAEKAKLNEYKAQCDNLAEIIRTPAKYFSLRFFWLIVDVFIWVWNSIINLF